MPKLDEKKLLFLLIFLHLVVAVPLAYYLNIWVDEASTLHTTANGLLPAITGALRDETQSPLYFALLSLWRMLGDYIFWARLFSVFCGILAIRVSFDVAKRFLPEAAQKFALVIFALHPFLFWAGTETRGYSLTILISALLLKYFYDSYLVEKPALASQVIYILVCAAALYTNYFLGFFLVGNFVALVAARRPKTAAIYIGHMAAVGVLFLPLLFAMSSQMGERHQLGDQSLYLGIRNSWQNIQTLMLPVNIFSDESNMFAVARLWIFRAGILLIFFAALWKRFNGISPNTIVLGAAGFVISLFLVSVATLLGLGYANIRHAAILLLPLILFFTGLLYELFGRRGLLVWGALLCMFYPAALCQQFCNPVKRGDWERVANFVKQNQGPDQPVLVFDPYDSLAFNVYYKNGNQVLPAEGYFEFQRANGFRSAETAAKQGELLTAQIPPGAKRVWLLTGEVCDLAETASLCRPLEDFFNSRYTIVKDERFHLERARLYEKNGN